MGKSQVCQWLRELGVPVLDSDQVCSARAPLTAASCSRRICNSPDLADVPGTGALSHCAMSLAPFAIDTA